MKCRLLAYVLYRLAHVLYFKTFQALSAVIMYNGLFLPPPFLKNLLRSFFQGCLLAMGFVSCLLCSISVLSVPN